MQTENRSVEKIYRNERFNWELENLVVCVLCDGGGFGLLQL